MNYARLSTLFTLVFVTSAVFVLSGCSSDGLPKRYAVSGTVTYKGEPVEQGTINFRPADPTTQRAATGQISDGFYRLTTNKPNDGAIPGSYKVTITSKNVDLSGAEEMVREKMGAGADTGAIALPQDAVAAANASATSNIPSKYSLDSTTPLEVMVEEKSNKFDFELED